MVLPPGPLIFFLLQRMKFLINFSNLFKNYNFVLFIIFVNNFKPAYAYFSLKLQSWHIFLLCLLPFVTADMGKNRDL